MAGTLLHSNFSFVTHTMPGAMYLGLAMGMALPRKLLSPGSHVQTGAIGWIGRAASAGLVLLLAFPGVQASRVLILLWPVWFGRPNGNSEAPSAALERIEEAQELWPTAATAGRAGGLARRTADSANLSGEDRSDWLNRSAAFFGQAVMSHPYDPEWAVNHANVLSILGRDEEAEKAYENAIRLEGGMEAMFRARYYFGLHLYRRWYRLWLKERRAEEALGQFIRARDHLLQAREVRPANLWAKEGAETLKGLEETISFLEGAGVAPR